MYTDKESYVDYFNKVSKYVKITIILKEVGISQSNFSHFMNNEHKRDLISVDRLQELENAIKQKLSSFI